METVSRPDACAPDPALGVPARKGEEAVAVDLIAVLVALDGDRPRILTVDGRALPSGPFSLVHRSLQAGLRDWVEQQTHQPIGYVEQLYTFADRDRSGDDTSRIVSISYLGLTRERRESDSVGRSLWLDWYEFFPWEDRRAGRQATDHAIEAALRRWIISAPDEESRRVRDVRCRIAFAMEGSDGSQHGWNEDLVLQRYELLFEAGLIAEARRSDATPLPVGRAMSGDHRRILATGIARLRAKIKYRPVVFELLPPTFTLLALQRSVEALAGRLLHKQNFRRLIEAQDLVEETGELSAATGGRPAKLVRFRRDVLDERAIAGSKLPLAGD